MKPQLSGTALAGRRRNRCSRAFRRGVDVACLLALLGALGCGSQTKGAPARTYDRGRGFSLQLPAGWERQERSGAVALLALSPAEGPRDRFRENVDVAVDSLKPGTTLEDYFNLGRKAIAANTRQFHEVAQGKTDLAGRTARWLVFQHRRQDRDLKVLSYFLVGNGRGYVLTFTALQDTYARHQAEFEAIARSFRLEP